MSDKQATKKTNNTHNTLILCGILETTSFPFGQGFASMAAPTRDLMQLVQEGKLRHGKHPVLDWNMGNVVAETDAHLNVKMSKKKSTEKIDGAVALVMGLARAMRQEGGLANSVYDERGLLFV